MSRKLIIIFLGLVFLWGCEDTLNMVPENSLTFKNGLESEVDVEGVLNGAQGLIRKNIAKGHWMLTLRGIVCDTTESDNLRNLEVNNALKNSWGDHYELIAQANVVLNFIDQVNASQERKDFYRGSAYFYKAFAYLDLIRYWGDCVIVEEEVPVVTKAKSYWTQVADHAIELADSAVRLLPDFNKVVDSKGNAARYKSTPCKGAANALLAHLCAWKAGGKYFAQPSERGYDENALWAKAEAACTEIIGSESGMPAGVYRLAATPEDVCTKTLVGGDAESIYESVYVGFWDEFTSVSPFTDNVINFQTYPMLDNGIMDVLSANVRISTRTVRDLFVEEDLRRDAYFYNFEFLESLPESITGGFAYPYKWRKVAVKTSGNSAGQFAHIDQNRIWWRLADIYLLRAECRVCQGKNDLAIADVNEVRRRASVSFYNASEYNGSLKMAVFKEREKELLFEGERYLDIIRNNYVRQMLGRGFRSATDQDYIDGCFFWGISDFALYDNPKLRQNTYWQRYE